MTIMVTAAIVILLIWLALAIPAGLIVGTVCRATSESSEKAARDAAERLRAS